MMITPDTSTVHLAAAFHIPAVVMFVSTTHEHGKYWIPYNTIHKSVIAPSNELRSLLPDDVFTAYKALAAQIRE
jgi:ADP-heptose:LPS heptosyltransferase